VRPIARVWHPDCALALETQRRGAEGEREVLGGVETLGGLEVAGVRDERG